MISENTNNNSWITETKRLLLREFKVEDAEFVYHLNLDSQVMRFTGDQPFNSISEAQVFLKTYDHYKKYSFGRWLVIDKLNKDPLGWCGLKYSQDIQEYDIGFRFCKKYWGHGYATEAALACRDLAFNKYGIKHLIGRAMKENTASINVLKKIGMQFLKVAPCGEEPGLVFALKAPKHI